MFLALIALSKSITIIKILFYKKIFIKEKIVGKKMTAMIKIFS